MALVVRRAVSLAPFVGLICLGIATVVRLAQGNPEGSRTLLEDSITYLIGVQGLVVGFGHMFFPDPIAESIGWQRGTPWQWEVGLASVSYGVLGSIASSYGADFWLATIIAFSVFYLGAGIGHVREMVKRRNFSPGNAGPIFFFDILVPVYLIVLYATVSSG